jgi:hypothetical protein
MADFGHIKSKRIETAEYVFHEIESPKPFTLIVRPAGETNKKYYNEMLRRAEHLQKRKAKINVDMIIANRDKDRELFPEYVVVGWKNVLDKDGKEVVFSKEDCAAFLAALDDDMFDGLRTFCSDASNFRATVDASAASGNSQTA